MNNFGCATIIFLGLGLLSGGLWFRYGSWEEDSSVEIIEVIGTDICETTTVTTTTETTYTTVTTTVTTTETAHETTVTEPLSADIYLGDFLGTYYRGEVNPCPGGSGRMLIDCSTGGMGVKGSVACRYVWSNYGYSHEGSRTVVRIEVPSYPEMNGMYYVDDCCAYDTVVDFYYPDYSRCPFQYDGVVSCRMWLVE